MEDGDEWVVVISQILSTFPSKNCLSTQLNNNMFVKAIEDFKQKCDFFCNDLID